MGCSARWHRQDKPPTQTRSSKNWIANQCDKTKYLLAGESDHLVSSVLVHGDSSNFLEVVKEFCYLGTVVISDNDISSEIRRHIVHGNRAYYGLHRLLRPRRLQTRTKCEIYRTLIRPVVLYGHES
ncbi:uncharacterized protein LOC120893502 [Anopheles arabiensis]|uniref:uncharacterized protein LOC120893502 n=1 Tax=Anopheles arabiensis TaxID=7173 RepID=UPI001AAC468B|nr:uncharacterized protein LOC120893502 [Anopheles arabiensis]